MKNLINNLKAQQLEKMIEKNRINAIVKQQPLCIELPDNFMKMKKCTLVKEVETCRYYKNILKETKIILPKKAGYLVFKTDGSVEVEIINKKDIVVKTRNNTNLPYHKTKIYAVEL